MDDKSIKKDIVVFTDQDGKLYYQIWGSANIEKVYFRIGEASFFGGVYGANEEKVVAFGLN